MIIRYLVPLLLASSCIFLLLNNNHLASGGNPAGIPGTLPGTGNTTLSHFMGTSISILYCQHAGNEVGTQAMNVAKVKNHAC
jgi:hypothetical protein